MGTSAAIGSGRAEPESNGNSQGSRGAADARMSHPTPLLLFDGECGLCARSVRFVLDRDKKKRVRFAPLQSQLGRSIAQGQGLDPDEPTTLVLVEESGRVSLRSTAALRACGELKMPWRLAVGLLIVPRFMRDAVYRSVSKHRLRWFGTADSCRLPTKEEQARFIE